MDQLSIFLITRTCLRLKERGLIFHLGLQKYILTYNVYLLCLREWLAYSSLSSLGKSHSLTCLRSTKLLFNFAEAWASSLMILFPEKAWKKYIYLKNIIKKFYYSAINFGNILVSTTSGEWDWLVKAVYQHLFYFCAMVSDRTVKSTSAESQLWVSEWRKYGCWMWTTMAITYLKVCQFKTRLLSHSS